jgi:hypothetical protein
LMGQKYCSKCKHPLWCMPDGVMKYWRHYATDYRTGEYAKSHIPDMGPCWCGCNHKTKYDVISERIKMSKGV